MFLGFVDKPGTYDGFQGRYNFLQSKSYNFLAGALFNESLQPIKENITIKSLGSSPISGYTNYEDCNFLYGNNIELSFERTVYFSNDLAIHTNFYDLWPNTVEYDIPVLMKVKVSVPRSRSY